MTPFTEWKVTRSSRKSIWNRFFKKRNFSKRILLSLSVSFSTLVPLLLDTDYFFCIIVPSIDLFSFMGSTFPMLGSIFEVRTFNFLEGRFWPLFFTVVGNPKVSSSYSSSIIPLGWSYLCELIFFRELRASNCLVSSSISQIFVSLAAGYFRFWTFFLNSL